MLIGNKKSESFPAGIEENNEKEPKLKKKIINHTIIMDQKLSPIKLLCLLWGGENH